MFVEDLIRDVSLSCRERGVAHQIEARNIEKYSQPRCCSTLVVVGGRHPRSPKLIRATRSLVAAVRVAFFRPIQFVPQRDFDELV